jgi:hypothetical protein
MRYNRAGNGEPKYNSYKGLYNHYVNGLSTAVPFSYKLDHFTRPQQVPYPFDSTQRNHPDAVGLPYTSPYGADSWHANARSTVFIDGHVRNLKTV